MGVWQRPPRSEIVQANTQAARCLWRRPRSLPAQKSVLANHVAHLSPGRQPAPRVPAGAPNNKSPVQKSGAGNVQIDSETFILQGCDSYSPDFSYRKYSSISTQTGNATPKRTIPWNNVLFAGPACLSMPASAEAADVHSSSRMVARHKRSVLPIRQLFLGRAALT